MYKIFIFHAVVSRASSPFSKFEQYDEKREKKREIPLLGTIVVPTIFEIISLFFSFFFPPPSQIGGRVDDNFEKVIAAFIPLRKHECRSRATRRSKRTFPLPPMFLLKLDKREGCII